MDFMANVLLASGCSPAMAHSLDEVRLTRQPNAFDIPGGRMCCIWQFGCSVTAAGTMDEHAEQPAAWQKPAAHHLWCVSAPADFGATYMSIMFVHTGLLLNKVTR
jgi:hypothetical protein